VMMAIYGVTPTTAILWLSVVVVITVAVAVAFAYPGVLVGVWFWKLRPYAVSLVHVLFFTAPGLVPPPRRASGRATTSGSTPDRPFRVVPGRRVLLRPRSGGLAVVLSARLRPRSSRHLRPLYRRDQREFAKVVE